MFVVLVEEFPLKRDGSNGPAVRSSLRLNSHLTHNLNSHHYSSQAHITITIMKSIP
jgi:hypothetical protein